MLYAILNIKKDTCWNRCLSVRIVSIPKVDAPKYAFSLMSTALPVCRQVRHFYFFLLFIFLLFQFAFYFLQILFLYLLEIITWHSNVLHSLEALFLSSSNKSYLVVLISYGLSVQFYKYKSGRKPKSAVLREVW